MTFTATIANGLVVTARWCVLWPFVDHVGPFSATVYLRKMLKLNKFIILNNTFILLNL